MSIESNSPSIVWNEEKMSVENEIINEQHKKLLDLINKLIFSIKNHSQVEDIESIIKEALDYAYYHFETEENIFDELDIPEKELIIHKKEHENFKIKVSNYYNNLKQNAYYKTNNGIEISEELFSYLINWLTHHIIEEDAKLLNKK